ncbi:spore germination protein [Cytobacillus firmus]|nr:spore germination protein [Cytobacillus firmus]
MKTRISSFELFFVLLQTQIGVGLLSLPYETYKGVKHDGWISILISGFMVQITIFLIWTLCRRFPHNTIFDFSKMIVGRFLGSVMNLGYIIYFLIVVSYVFLVFTDLIKRWILTETPAWIFLLIGFFILVYGCWGTVKDMVSLFSFISVFILGMLLITFFVFLEPGIDLRYLFPIGSAGIWAIIKSTKDSFVSFLGFETLLIYFAFMKNPGKAAAIKGAISANLFITFFYAYLVIIATIMFSPDEIILVPEPVLYMLKAISLTILERLDLLFLSIWVIVVASTVISYSYLASMGINKLLHLRHKKSVLIAGAFVLSLSFLLYGRIELSKLGKLVTFVSYFFGVIFPAILLVISFIFKKRGAYYEEN